MILGVGLDLVDLDGFARQLDDPASGFVAATFTAGERRGVATSDRRGVEHLAARFAAKEAFTKAWSVARFGRPPALAALDLRQIEVVGDAFGRPALRLHGAVAGALADLVPDRETLDLHLSLSHDGPVAAAVVVVALRPADRY